MRWSQYFVPTLKEAPSDAEIASHKLMVRAGMIHKAPGGYTWLPLGLRALKRVEAIVRNHMGRLGAVEVCTVPRQTEERDGKPERACIFDYADPSPFMGVARSHIGSYRQLPKVLFQIQTRSTGEPHQRSAMLFPSQALTMDAYVLTRNPVSLYESCHQFDHMLEDLCRLTGLAWFWIGGDGSDDSEIDVEYIAIAGAGEKRIARSDSGYVGIIEHTNVQPYPKEKGPAPGDMRLVDTPGTATVVDVSNLLRVPPSRVIKTLIYLADSQPVAALVRGDHELNEYKLRTQINASALMIADPATVESVTGAPVGFAGPVGLRIPMIVDFAVDAMAWGVTGANKAGAHFVNVVPNRDFPVLRTEDIHLATEGDLDPLQAMPLTFHRGIEVGHVFTLGRQQSEALGATYLDETGNLQYMAVGYVGISLTRILAAAIETSHDDAGIIWKKSLAPFDCEIVAIDVRDDQVRKAAGDLHDALTSRGIDVLYDDRDLSPGIKFNDADLIGLPLRVTIGKRSLKKGGIELKRRTAPDIETVPLPDAPSRIAALVQS